MSELLIELFSEEIPARMQPRAADDLKRLMLDGLTAQGLISVDAMGFSTPRRIGLVVRGLPPKSPAVSEERKGPRVGAPDAAVQGFLKAANLKSLGDATIVRDEKKGDFYVARVEKAGRPTPDIIADVLRSAIATFPWPKSMRWGAGDLTWVRPLQGIVCLFGGKVVPVEIAGIASGDETRGHRFHGDAPFAVKSFEDYATKLKEQKVLLLASERASWIGEQAEKIAKAEKLELVADGGLTQENAGLTEWPTVLMGRFDDAFLDVPAECLTSAMRQHQKCFSLKDPKTGKLAARFLTVSNLIAPDGGKTIIAGNEKVIRARLTDAKFFWEQDLKRPLDEMASELAGITFHVQLGTQRDRVERIAELAFHLAGACDADPEDARRAAQLAKADLVSGMVGEFPELQGLMGRYYATKGGIKPAIARAIELHYKPKGPADSVPREDAGDAVACAVALADKIDTLVGFWAIGEKPTGSGDPYQLRRAALGVIRIMIENDFRIALVKPLMLAAAQIEPMRVADDVARRVRDVGKALNRTDLALVSGQRLVEVLEVEGTRHPDVETIVDRMQAYVYDLLAFFADRLKVHLREDGKRHDLIDAVFALPGQDDIALIVKRVAALDTFLKTDDGANLLAGVKRAANILGIEEKKDKTSHARDYDVKLLVEKEELALAAAIESVKQDTVAAIAVENFTGAMNALAELRAPVDAFFDKVTVNAPDAKLRANRLALLSQIRAATHNVADFSKIAG
jgi:glycyl-tRNA synthetase beta chain